MFRRNNKGWLRLDDLQLQHYWYRGANPALYHSLCGLNAAPTKIDSHSKLPRCEMCQSIRHMETGDTSKAAKAAAIWS